MSVLHTSGTCGLDDPCANRYSAEWSMMSSPLCDHTLTTGPQRTSIKEKTGGKKSSSFNAWLFQVTRLRQALLGLLAFIEMMW